MKDLNITFPPVKMEELVQVCLEIVNFYRSRKFTYTNKEEEVFSSLKKFSKCVNMFNQETEIFSRSCEKFWEENKTFFEIGKRETWYKNNIKFYLYTEEGKVVKGPMIDVTALYNMASYVDSLKSKNQILNKDTFCLRLQKELFKVISSYVEEFKTEKGSSSVTRPIGGGGGGFDMSKIGLLLNTVIDSGIIPNSEKVDKGEINTAITRFMSDPNVKGVVDSIGQIMSGEKTGSFDMESVGEVLSSLTKKN